MAGGAAGGGRVVSCVHARAGSDPTKHLWYSEDLGPAVGDIPPLLALRTLMETVGFPDKLQPPSQGELGLFTLARMTPSTIVTAV